MDDSKQAFILYENHSLTFEIGKRMMDVVGAFVGLVLLSPLFILIAILIKLDDPKGKVFFKQIRIGKDGKQFYMYKFRSMVENAETLLQSYMHLNEVSGAMYKVKNDPRVTRIGRIIRKFSLDELPQLWNVLKGDMSLVGPRPPLPWEFERYTTYDKQRLLVTPGCTGLWQVSGRSKLGFNEMVELDLKYIQQQSLWFDFILILKTIGVMIRAKDAY